ncbi:MAG: ABC transporter substrate-binding protein [bacterium]
MVASCKREPEPIRIGSSGFFQNPNEAEYDLQGIRIAVEDANKAGGIHGHQVEIEVAHDSGLGESAVRIASRFVADPRILAVIGPGSSAAMIAAAPIYNGRLAAVSGMATAPELTGISPWVFRVVPSDSALGVAEARLFLAKGWQRIAVLYDNDGYGRGMARAFAAPFRALGGDIVGYDPIIDETTDFGVFIRTYDQTRPDAVFVICNLTSAKAFVNAAAAHPLRAQVIGGDGWETTMAHEPAAEGAIWPAAFSPLDTHRVASQFTRAFIKRFGREPNPFAALSYDATLTVLDAIRRGGLDRSAVRRALAEDTRVAGATGAISFDRGERVGGAVAFVRVTNGQLKPVDLEAAAPPPQRRTARRDPP